MPNKFIISILIYFLLINICISSKASSPIVFSTNPFVVNGLSAGTYNMDITKEFCNTDTGNFTLTEPTLELPPIPKHIKVTTINVSQTNNTYRFEVDENLPTSTPTRIAANGWEWQFTGDLVLGQSVILDSGITNANGTIITCKKFKVTISNNRSTTLCDNVKVCYTSLIGNGPYQSTFSSELNFKRIPIPTHIVVKDLDPSPEGYRRFRYSAPDSVPVATDSEFQTTGWQWSFSGNLSQSIFIDSGNYNSKQIVVKLITNEAENAGDYVMLAYLSNCGMGGYITTKITHTSGHKYIFENHSFDGLGTDEFGNWANGFSEFWNNPNNWDEYPGTHLYYGDTVIIGSAYCVMNIPVEFDYGSVLTTTDQFYSYLTIESNLTSNGKIFSNGYINFNESGNLLGNYFMENNGHFEQFNSSYDQPGTIINNGWLGMYGSNNYGKIISNNNNCFIGGENYGTIEINNQNGIYLGGVNYGTIINNGNNPLSIYSNYYTGKIINNNVLYISNFTNHGQIINNDSLMINGYFENYSVDSLVLNNYILLDGSFNNYSKVINHGNIVLNNYGSIFNSDFFQSPFTGFYENRNSTFINENDGRISGSGYIYNQGIGINKGEIKCTFIINNKLFKNDNNGVIECGLENYNYNSTFDTTQIVFENIGLINLPINNGWFNNYNALFKNYGIFNNYSPWAWEGNSIFMNYGTLNNYSEYYPSHTINYGTINNDSIINLFNEYQENNTPRTIDNYSIINNNGAIIGSGDINNITGITINNGIVSPGSTKNASIVTLNNTTTSQSLINTISPSTNSETFKIGSLTFSDFIGTPTFDIEISDTNSITGHDFVTVNDTLNAGGTINLSISYLPNPNDEITIMHADTVVNQFDTVNIPSGWSLLYNYPNKGDISVKYDKTNLNIKAFMEGYYLGNNTMNTLLYNMGLSEDATAVDSIEMQMWSPDNLNATAPTFSAKTIIHNDGNATINLPIDLLGNNYFIAIKHRNCIETWSSSPVSIKSTTDYDFSSGLGQAYGDGVNDPMKYLGNGVYALYGGDVNQDGGIDISDMQITENDASQFAYGYYNSDCNGDGGADITDMQIIENNAGMFIFYARP